MIIKNDIFDTDASKTGLKSLSIMLNTTEDELTRNLLIFDIETTGFAPKTTSCYLIGCVYNKDGQWNYIQWFADSPSDEILVIWNFFEFAKDYKYLLHFNGEGFDIPYIQDKCKLLRLPYTFDAFVSIDIFKVAKSIKELLKLENHKQKTIETFLGITRDDKYSGGELINVYKELAVLSGKDKEDACNTLLLHNHDDICALVRLTSIFNYTCLDKLDESYIEHTINDTLDYGGEPVKEIIFSCQLPCSVPTAASCGKEPYYLKFAGNKMYLRVRMYEGELKHFFTNYKDYYYLPEEDYAIHKSVAFYVDKNFRTQAKAVNCYTKKSGVFMPQITELETPHFRLNYGDKQTYFELNNLFLNDSKRVADYVEHIIGYLLPSYRKTSYHTHNQDHDD